MYIEQKYPLVHRCGMLGFECQDSSGLFTVLASGDNHFLLYGIAENSMIVVNPNVPYEKGKLNVFRKKNPKPDGSEMYLATKRKKGHSYMGRVMMAINQYL